LIGGDTTHGDLSITIQVMGLVNKNAGLLRSGAQSGDKLYVTGTLGDAAAGLATILQDFKFGEAENNSFCQKRLNNPTARLNESNTIKLFASACIDVSDGLLQDLSHILKASNIGTVINTKALPFSTALKSLDTVTATSFALSGGDDYELLFTIPARNEELFLKSVAFPISCIGHINSDALSLVDEKGEALESSGYNHFK
jgi:thiamine-monophosphate kinase